MEVDERLRWLESRVSSSLHPKGENLRSLFSDNENRLAFLDFCNNSEIRHLFVHLPSEEAGSLHVSPNPPDSLSTKSLFFLKNSYASRLSKDTISEEVVCSECSQNPMEHLELIIREIYLPILADQNELKVSPERVLDILHRLMNIIQVTQGHQSGDVVLPIPSLDILVDGAVNGTPERKAVVVHIMESCVVSWMRQVKMAVHFDPNGSILKSDGKMAGPMAEVKYWEDRLQQLLLVRSQLSSVEVLRILNGLEHARSTYADAFIDVHRDVNKVIVDTELITMYVNTLKPWFLKLREAFSPDTLLKIFPSLIVTLSLVWQYSSFYSLAPHFYRLLRLIANELARKARDIVGTDPLINLNQACVNIRLALRICSAFRGHYLDRKDSAEKVLIQNREQLKKIQQESIHGAYSKDSFMDNLQSSVTVSSLSGQARVDTPSGMSSTSQLCTWPPRNAPVFNSLNHTMERCNDLLELVQTIEHFNELSAICDQCSSDGQDPILIDIYDNFQSTLSTFQSSTKDLMSLEQSGFEKSFFEFRTSVKELETKLSAVLLNLFEECLSLESSLQLLESFQGLISRESTLFVLRPKLDTIIDVMQSDVDEIKKSLPSFVLSSPPTLLNTPPTSTKLLWLNALKQRVEIPIGRIRSAAPYLLQGEKGFTLRHSYSDLLKELDKQWNAVVSSWIKCTPQDIETTLHQTILHQNENNELKVNYNLKLEEIIREIHYLTGPVLNVNLPSNLNSLSKYSPHILHQHKVGLEVSVLLYNNLHSSLDNVHKGLFQHRLLLVDKLLQEGLHQLDWLNSEVPDFLAKFKTILVDDIIPLVEHVQLQSKTIKDMTQSWGKELPILCVFSDLERASLEELKDIYSKAITSTKRILSIAVTQIDRITKDAFKSVEVSWESPAWCDYLSYLDDMILNGLKQMILHSMNTLILKAQKYEQGGSIPPIISVSLELCENKVQFSPPLSTHSSITSIPEVIKECLEGLLSLCKIPQRHIQSKKTYYKEITSDNEVQNNVQKIIAHVETSARQCQSLRKRFSQYGFLWEQDVLATFDDFINGIGEPHPRKFTRPETVNRTRSASQSAKSRTHSAVPVGGGGPSSQTASSVLESVIGASDWEFLKPDKPSTPADSITSRRPATVASRRGRRGMFHMKPKKNPTLEDFDGEIAVFQGIMERLVGYLNVVDVGWICVHQTQVKSTLISLVSKWTHTYASYLEKKILLVLNELETFFVEIEPQIESMSGEDMDPEHIMTLVTIFNKVNLQQLVMDGKFGAVHRAVVILDKFRYPLSVHTRDQFEAIPHRWSSLKKRLSLSRQRVSPFIQSHSVKITRDLQQFGSEANEHRNSFLSSECLMYECDNFTAQLIIKKYNEKLLSLKVRAIDLMELQELLQSAIVNFNILKQFEDELNTANLIWKQKQVITDYHDDIKSQVWLTVDFEEMEETCDNHMNSLTELGECSIEWDIRIHLEEAVKELQLTAPLLHGLSSKNMRGRHWKHILRYSSNLGLLATLLKNGALEMSVLKQLTVGRFMDLKLIDYSTDILSIVDRSSKEVAIEELLKNLEEVWLGMQFQLKPYIRLHGNEQAACDIGIEAGRTSSQTSSIVRRKSVSSGRISVISATPNVIDKQSSQSATVMLLDNVETIFDALDHYQTYLQSLEGSVAAMSFTDELGYWHKQLQTVEAVLRLWLQVQNLWILLEEILTSGEAAQHLPTAHFNFTMVDKDWKLLLKNTAKSPNVISTCLQEDLLQTLEKFFTTLNQCQSALLQYVEGRRIKCPWLYFLTLEDILQLVCYGSSLFVLGTIFPKVITNSTGIVFNNNLPLGFTATDPSPHITGVLGNQGEKLDLIESIECFGTVELILNHLLYSISETLKKQLDHCYAKCTQCETIAKKFTMLWTSHLSHQIIQLGTMIFLQQITLEAIQKQSKEALGLLLTDIQSLIQSLCDISQGNVPSNMEAISMTGLTAVHVTGNAGQLTATFTATDDSVMALHTDSNPLSPSSVHSHAIDNTDETSVSFSQQALYQNLMLVLLSFQHKIKELMSDPEPHLSFSWQSSIHYSYDQSEQTCMLESIGVSLSYGFNYSGEYPFRLIPSTERLMVYLLQVMRQHYSGLISTKQTDTVFSTVNDIAVGCGYPVFPILCSSPISNSVLINYFKGIATTGSWLYLHNFNLFPLQLIQVTIELVNIIREAKLSSSYSLKISNDTLRMIKVDTTFCVASTFDNLSLTFVSSVFKNYSLVEIPLSMAVEARLIINKFTDISNLTQFLSQYAKQYKVLRHDIQAIITRSIHHINKYIENRSVNTATNGVYSAVTHHVIVYYMQELTEHESRMISKQSDTQRGNLAVVQEEDEEEQVINEEDTSVTMQRHLEQISVLVSIWELQLAVPALELFEEFFSKISVESVLEKLDKSQQEMIEGCSWSREDIESAHESRTTSVMQSDKDALDPQYIEDVIIRACLVKCRIPSVELQKSVYSLLMMILEHKVIQVNGSWQNGRKECIETCIEVLKSIGYNINVTTLPISAMEHGSLLGNKDKVSVLSQVLSKLQASSVKMLHLVLLEGSVSQELVDCLQCISDKNKNMMHFPNMVSCLLDPSIKFLVVTSAGSGISSIPCLSLEKQILSWKYLIQAAFLKFDKAVQEHLTLLCQTHLPTLFDLLSPVCHTGDAPDDDVVEDSLVESQKIIFSPQEVVLDELQLVNSMCRVLKCLLFNVQSPSTDAINNSFIYTLIWTIGSALNEHNKTVFQKWMRNNFSDSLNSLDDELWHYKLTSSYQFETCQIKNQLPYIHSIRTMALVEYIKFLYTNNVHIILDGPCGSGKTEILLDAINSSLHQHSGSDTAYSLMHVYLNQASNPDTIWKQLQENLKWHSGITYLPYQCDKLIALLDDIHLISQVNDNCTGFGSIISMVNHHIQTGTILAPPSYKKHNVGGITYILSTDSTQATISNDILGQTVYIYWEGYSSTELVLIYSTLLENHFSDLTEVITLLVHSAVQIHNKLQSLFIESVERRHYCFNGTVLYTVLKQLTLQLNSTVPPMELLSCWLYESYWNYAAQLTSAVDRERYQECVTNTLRKYFSDSPLLPELLVLVHTLPSHKVKEDLMEEALTAAQKELDLLSPTPLISLYDSTLSISSRISSLLEAPHSLSSLLLIGMGHIEPLLSLVTFSKGFNMQRPSQVVLPNTNVVTSYDLEQFKLSLKSIYITAGTKNDHVLVFLDHQELLDSTYFSHVYQFTKDCSVTVEFTDEERSRVVNSIRSEVTQDGQEYTEHTAWEFFINRLKANVRFVISIPDLSFVNKSGLVKMKNLLCIANICYQLPWNKRELLHVANYHLKKCSLPRTLQETTEHLLSSIHVALRENIPVDSLSCCYNNQYEYFVERFCYEMQNWQEKLSEEYRQLDQALSTFSKAKERLNLLNEKLRREEVVLEEKGKSYGQLLVQIGQDTAIAKEQNKLVRKQSERIDHLQKVLPEYEHIHILYLEELEHIETQTKNIALNLEQQSLLELRSLTKPPMEIQELLEAVIIIIKSPAADLSWTKGAKRLMANVDRFKEMLMEFPSHQDMSEILLECLEPYIVRPRFNEESFGQWYLAAAQLCSWVKGVESYHRMLVENIRRLEHRKSTVKASLHDYTEKLTQLQHKVQILDQRLTELSISLEQASIEKSQQSQVVVQMSKELKETTQFIESLQGLNARWISRKHKLSFAVTNKVGQLALSVSFITYFTALQPQLVIKIARDLLKTCMEEKGLPLDSGTVLYGLLGSIHFKPSNDDALTATTEEPSPRDEVEQLIENDFSSKTLSDRPSHDDFSPTQSATELPQFRLEIKKSLEEQPSLESKLHPPLIEDGDITFENMAFDQYKTLFVNILHTFNPNQSLKALTVSSDTLMHRLLAELFDHTWNKWPLVYDPHNIIMTILLTDDKWKVLDGQDISYSLLYSLEQSLLDGQCVLLHKLVLPIHPALIPVIQAGLVWNKTDERPLSLEYCGKHIHVHKSFRLVLTTQSLPVDLSLSQTLCSFNVISLSPSIQLMQEFLVRESANNELMVLDTSHFESQMRGYGQQLMKYLDKVNDGVVDKYTVDQIETLMKNFTELQESYETHCQSLEKQLQYLDNLRPICLFGSICFMLLQSLSKIVQNFSFTCTNYNALFQSVLAKTKDLTEFKRIFADSLLNSVSKFLSRSWLHFLSTCIYILSLWDTSNPISPLQINQLLYIALGDYYTLDGHTSTELPPKPDCIPEDMMIKLCSLPVDSAFLKEVLQSISDNSEAWEKMVNDDIIPSPDQLLWVKEGEHAAYSLDDLVILKAIVPNAVSSFINDSVVDTVQSLPVPMLTNILPKYKEGTPLLLLYNEKDLISQAGIVSLQNTLKGLTSGQEEDDACSLVTLSLGLQSESVLTDLHQTNADYILIKNIHLATEDWLRNLSVQLQRFSSESESLVILAGEHCVSLPIQLLNHCCIISLSVLAPNPDCQQLLPKLTTTSPILQYLYSLLVIFSCLPRSLLDDLDKLPPKNRLLVFLLSAFHTHVYTSSSSTQLHNLVYSLSRLLIFTDLSLSSLLLLLHSLLYNTYSTVNNDSIQDLSNIITLYVSEDLLQDNTSVILNERFTLPLPSSVTSPRNYNDHVIGILKSISEDTKQHTTDKQKLLNILCNVLHLC